MYRIIFVCHGNICRSPMAEFIMRDMLKKEGMSDMVSVDSAATSTEEIGNPVHFGTKRILSEMGISCALKTAVQLTRSDYGKYDLIIGMDSANIRNILRITGGDPEGKVHKLLHFADMDRDVADPWYTGDFETTKRDVVTGCTALIKYLKGSN